MASILVGKSRHGHTVGLVYCDQCADEGREQLHSTLYAIDVPYKGHASPKYLCEIHAVFAELRPMTPEFRRAVHA